MKKILFVLIYIVIMTSCNRENIEERIISRHDDGNKKEVYYYKVNNDGSKTRIRETWYYKEGMIHLDGPISDEVRNGIFETYYKSGQLLSRGEFVNGKREGKAVTYHENGNIMYEGFYKDGKECGIWRFYDKDGNLYNEDNRDLR